MGQGVQPQPSKPHPAYWVGLLPGEPQVIFRPSEKRAAHGPVAQRGQSPAPSSRSGRATWVTSGVQPEPQGARTATPKASGTRVARPLEPPCGVRGLGARYWRGRGRPAREAACRPSDRRAAVLRGLTVEASASTVSPWATVCKTVAPDGDARHCASGIRLIGPQVLRQGRQCQCAC